MREFKKSAWSRVVLYSSAAALAAMLLLSGVVFGPDNRRLESPTLQEHESTLALLMGMNRVDAAKEEIAGILRIEPGNLYALLMLAYIRDKEGDLEGALGLYRESLKSMARAPQLKNDVMDMLSMTSFRAGKYWDAADYAQAKIEEFGENVISRLIIALSSFCLDDDKGFEDNMDLALEWGRLDPAMRIRLKSLFEKDRDLDRIYLRLFRYQAEREKDQIPGLGI